MTSELDPKLLEAELSGLSRHRAPLSNRALRNVRLLPKTRAVEALVQRGLSTSAACAEAVRWAVSQQAPPEHKWVGEVIFAIDVATKPASDPSPRCYSECRTITQRLQLLWAFHNISDSVFYKARREDVVPSIAYLLANDEPPLDDVVELDDTSQETEEAGRLQLSRELFETPEDQRGATKYAVRLAQLHFMLVAHLRAYELDQVLRHFRRDTARVAEYRLPLAEDLFAWFVLALEDWDNRATATQRVIDAHGNLAGLLDPWARWELDPASASRLGGLLFIATPFEAVYQDEGFDERVAVLAREIDGLNTHRPNERRGKVNPLDRGYRVLSPAPASAVADRRAMDWVATFYERDWLPWLTGQMAATPLSDQADVAPRDTPILRELCSLTGEIAAYVHGVFPVTTTSEMKQAFLHARRALARCYSFDETIPVEDLKTSINESFAAACRAQGKLYELLETGRAWDLFTNST